MSSLLRPSRSLRAATFAIALLSLGWSSFAYACGGFFCNTQNPIDQAAERVLYITGGGKVTAHIQIRYEGPSAQFSWVLPLAKVPKLGIGSDSVFTMLEMTTRPTYYLQQQYGDEKCHFNQCMYMAASGGPGGRNSVEDADGGVKVLA